MKISNLIAMVTGTQFLRVGELHYATLKELKVAENEEVTFISS